MIIYLVKIKFKKFSKLQCLFIFQGVPVLILANKQDLPGAREPKELEKLLGLHELLTPTSINISSVMKSCSSSTGNIVTSTKATVDDNDDDSSRDIDVTKATSIALSSKCSSSSPSNQQSTRISNDTKSEDSTLKNHSSTSLLDSCNFQQQQKHYKLNHQHTSQKSLVSKDLQSNVVSHTSSPSSLVCTPTSSTIPINCPITGNSSNHSDNISKLASFATSSSINNTTLLPTSNTNSKSCSSSSSISSQYKGWHIQPACAITGEGLQEGLEALYNMILKRRKFQKIHKKRR